MSETSEAEAQKARARARRTIPYGSAIAAFALLFVPGIAAGQGSEALQQQRATEELLRQSQITVSGLLSHAANAAFGKGETMNAALLSLEGLPDTVTGVARPYVTEAEWQLDRANRALQERLALGHDGPVTAAAFSPDGARIVTASSDKTARLWDAATGKGPARLVHHGTVSTAAFSPDGAKIMTVSFGEPARLWDAATGKELARLAHEGEVTEAAFSPDGAKILTTSFDRTLGWRWDGPGDVWYEPVGGPGWIEVEGWRWTTRLWDAATGKELARLAYEGPVTAGAFSPDGTKIVTASSGHFPPRGVAPLWDAATGKVLATLVHDGPVSKLTGKELIRLNEQATIDRVAFSPDGAKILTTSFDKTARLWDAATGKELARLAHDMRVTAAAFSPDGAKIVTATGYRLGIKGEARLWDAVTGKELASLPPEGGYTAVAFSLDGTRIVTASSDKTARLWDAATGKELARLAHDGPVTAAAFSPGAGPLRIITVSGNEARLWQVARSTDELVQTAKSRVTRCLTQGQRAEYFLPEAPPVWCITGPGLEAEKDPAKWQPKWPYQSAAWRDWLADRQRGENPPVPASQ
jgi:WD40 repeat protein